MPIESLSSDDRYARDPSALSLTRMVISWVTLVAVYVDPTEPTLYADFVYGMLSGYAGYASVLFLLTSERRVPLERKYEVALHCVDVVIAAVLTLLTEGAGSPFFVYFGFILLAAAWRWGFWPTIATAASVLFLLLGEAVLGSFQTSILQIHPLELNRYIVRSTYVVLLAVVVGYLSEAEKEARIRAGTIADIIAGIEREARFMPSLARAAEGILRLFRSRRLVVVASETSGQYYAWDCRLESPRGRVVLRADERSRANRDEYVLETPAAPWLLRRSRRGGRPWELVRHVGPDAHLRAKLFSPPPAFLSANPFNVVIGTSHRLSDDWECRVLLFDPVVRLRAASLIEAFDTVIQNVAPSIYNAFLIRRLRSRAQAMERARVARELHDHVLQSLIGVEMQLDALRRAREPRDGEHKRLADLQQHLRDEIIGVRELMQNLSPIDVRPGQLLAVLGDLVERFERQTGIRTRFTTDVEVVNASTQVCREIVSIVTEALTNVRKHSGAHNALVRMNAAGDSYRLVIEDDGRGFEFAGNRTLADMETARTGPRVLTERVRNIGGQLTIASTPGEGARLEIALPAAPHAA